MNIQVLLSINFEMDYPKINDTDIENKLNFRNNTGQFEQFYMKKQLFQILILLQ